MNMTENKNVYIAKDASKNKKILENYYTLRPIILLENCAGIFRFYMKNGQLQHPNWAMKLYSAVLLIIYLTAFAYALRIPAALTGQDSLVDMMDEVPSFVILFHYTSTMITTSYFLGKSNMEIITTIAELDDKLIRAHDFYTKDRIKYIKCLIALCLMQSAIIITDIITQQGSRAEVIVITMYLIQQLEIFTFCVFIRMVKCRLVLINGYLTKFLEDKDGKKNGVYTLCDITALSDINLIGCPSDSNMKIRDLALMYDKLGIICSLINRVYNFQIFMSLVSTFFFIVITIWTSLYYYKSSENNSGPLLSISIWCFTTILFVAGMCFVCEKLRSTRNSTKILVNQFIMDYDLPKTMRVQAKAFMELIEALPFRVLVYDMFSVDITLMLKFISVATTYLIVIIQISHFIN